ncbi:MAG: lipopolysaccharide heptosyltransferase family protein, partial [Fusobacterium necrophorum]|nr:lipopolysaccharide heptosyltransferase family protein [Fusobacterium necrophorum]
PRHLAQALGLPCFALFNPTADKKEWLPYPSASNVGIEPKDTLAFHKMTEEEYKILTKEEAFSLMTVPFILEKLDLFLSAIL